MTVKMKRMENKENEKEGENMCQELYDPPKPNIFIIWPFT